MARRTIFVFGSNKAGRHGKGHAKAALIHHGAIYGCAEGLQGDSYGIPTKDAWIQPLPLHQVVPGVRRFLEFARTHPDWDFEVSPIGCRLAGFTAEQIAPLFKEAPHNCYLHPDFVAVLKTLNFPVNDRPLPARKEHVKSVQQMLF